MFEASLVESSGSLRSKSGRYMWVTGTLNIIAVGILLLLPLLYPEALPRTALAAMLTAPPPPPAPLAPRAVAAVKPVEVRERLDPLTAPSRVPTQTSPVHDEAPPPTLQAGVAGLGAPENGGLGPAGAPSFVASAPVVVVAPPPHAAGLAHVSSGVIAGNKVAGSSPVYPAIAKAAHVSGTVVLHAVISRAGTIQSLGVVSGPELLRASAVSAVQDWRYRPYLLNGEPTEVDTTITVNFSFGA